MNSQKEHKILTLVQRRALENFANDTASRIFDLLREWKLSYKIISTLTRIWKGTVGCQIVITLSNNIEETFRINVKGEILLQFWNNDLYSKFIDERIMFHLDYCECADYIFQEIRNSGYFVICRQPFHSNSFSITCSSKPDEVMFTVDSFSQFGFWEGTRIIPFDIGKCMKYEFNHVYQHRLVAELTRLIATYRQETIHIEICSTPVQQKTMPYSLSREKSEPLHVQEEDSQMEED